MANHFLAILLFLSSVSFGQGYSNFGNSNPNDTARTVNNVLINKYLRLQIYAPSANDTVLISSRMTNGAIFSYSIKSLVSRINSSIQPVDTTSLSNRINNKANINGDNANGTWPITANNSNKLGDIPFTNTALPTTQPLRVMIYEPDNFRFTTAPLYTTIIDTNFLSTKRYVDSSVSAINQELTESSFDTTFSITSNSITSARFSGKQVVSILFDTGVQYLNDIWFTQAGTTITLLNDLKAIAGRRATITLR